MIELIKQLFMKKINDSAEESMKVETPSITEYTSVAEITDVAAPAKFFSDKELKCKCGCNKVDMDEDFMRMLNKARSIAGKPWKVNSAYRCAEHNAKVGGKKNSAHVLGCAADISAPTSQKKFEIVTAALQAGFTRIGIGSNFVHLDAAHTSSHPANVLWTY